MVPFIETAREIHGVRSAQDYRRRQAAVLQTQTKRGGRSVVHDSTIPVVAYIAWNRWVIDCECGAGNATDPANPFACCFGCGAVHERVQFPPNVQAIERVLLQRVKPSTRNWFPQETVDDLIAENVAHGVGG